MRISRLLSLAGPNVWSSKPVLEVWLCGKILEPACSACFHERRQRLADWWSAACTAAAIRADERLRFTDHLRRAEQEVEAFQVLILALQTLAGTPVSQGWAEEDGPGLVTRAAVEIVEEPVARLAVAQAHRLIWDSPSEVRCIGAPHTSTPHSKSLSPSPLVGEGRGGGASVSWLPTPTLTLPHQGGGDSKAAPIRASDSFSSGQALYGSTPAMFPASLFNPGDVVAGLRACAEACCFGTTTRAIVAAARARRIPVSRVDDDSLLQLGHGARQRRIQGAITGRAGFLAELVSRDKLLTKRLLRQLCLPTAEGRLVASAEDAWAAACEIGLPVVVKPRNADYGNGVSLDLMTQADVVAAWNRAREFRPEVLVERQLAGVPHRLFVVNDRLVAAARREPAHVVGDGRMTVGALIDYANRDPRRGDGPDFPLYPISIDPPLVTALARQDLCLDSVPAAGRVVNLQLDPSECRAETILDVTDRVHPAVSAAANDAVRAVGLDVAGVDIVAVDIGRPLEEQGGGILEVNAGPAIYLHRNPQCQPGRPVAEAIVESLFAPGDTGRIPLIAVVGQKRPAVTARTIARLVADGTQIVGLSGSDGITIGERRVSAAPAADSAGCRTLLAHPRPELAVCELSPESIRNEGLPFDECTVAVLAGFDRRALESALARERDQILRLMVDTVASGGSVVANVEDTEVAAACTPGQARLVAVALHANHPFLIAHRHRGGTAIFGAGGGISVGKSGRKPARMVITRRTPVEDDDSSAVTIETLMAHAAAATLNGALRTTPTRAVRARSGERAVVRS